MKKIIVAALLCLFGISSVFAQNWTKETQKIFRCVNGLDFFVDLSNANIMGVSRDKFAIYYSNKNHTSEEFAELLLEKFQTDMQQYFFSSGNTPKIYCPGSPYKVIYEVTEINENGGIRGYCYVDNNGNLSAKIPFVAEDGRWNDFETLLKERVIRLMNRNLLYKNKLYQY